MKELLKCTELLKEPHLQDLRTGGLGHLPDWKIKTNINRRLICFLMYNIDPTTMTLDLGDGKKKLQITAYGIQMLFGLPGGRDTPPRPSDNGNDEAVMLLKQELGIPRNKHINTDILQTLLKELVKDEASHALAMKVFGLILYMKFICPGYFVRVSREAPMFQEMTIAELKDVDLCHLLVDELKRAVINWQKAGADWRAVPGCCIASLLMYLDCIHYRKLSPKDKRTPRILYMDEKNF